MNAYLEVSLPRLAASLGFIVVAVVVSRGLRLGVARSIVIGTARAAVQLLAVGSALALLFQRKSALGVVLTLVVMITVAAFTSARRVEHGPPARLLVPWSALALVIAVAMAVVPLFAFILPVEPFYDPRYVVPLSAMMLSSSMNVVAQVFERVFSLASTDRDRIETLLSLGASPAQAFAPHARAAVKAALIPTVNGLLTAGLVSLPGMMTGQIVSGVDPTQAVRYQLVILYQLVAVTSVAGALAALFARRFLLGPRETTKVIGAGS